MSSDPLVSPASSPVILHLLLVLSLLRNSKKRGLRNFEVIEFPGYLPNFEEMFSYCVRYVFYCFSHDSIFIQGFLVGSIGRATEYPSSLTYPSVGGLCGSVVLSSYVGGPVGVRGIGCPVMSTGG